LGGGRRGKRLAVFASFEFDLGTLELRKRGVRLRLEGKPAKALACLVEHAGHVVERDDLIRLLWPTECHGDFGHRLNKAINKLRFILGDDPSDSRFIKTHNGRGYSFVAEAGIIEPEPVEAPKSDAPFVGERANPVLRTTRWISHWAWGGVLAGFSALTLVIVLLASVRNDSLPTHQRLTYDDGIVDSARFTPDGNTIVYGAAWNGEPFRLFWTREGSKESSRFNLPDADILSISRSGDMAILLDRKWRWGFERSGTLAVVPLTGGYPRNILDDVEDADWTPDGSSLAVTHLVGTACILELPVGHKIYQGNGYISNPRISPDGDLIAIFEHPVIGNDSGSVVVMDRTGKKRFVWDGWSGLGGLAWKPKGEAIWFSGYRDGGQKQVYELAMSGERRTVFRESGNVKLHDITRGGRVLLTVDDLRAKTFLHTRGGAHVQDISLLDLSYATGLSRDGRTVLMDAWGDAASQKEDEAYLVKTDRPPLRLGTGRPWQISPDGKSVLAVTTLGTSGNFSRQLQLLPIGSGEPKPLTRDYITHSFAAWMPNGKEIVFVGHEPARLNRSWVQNVVGGSPRAITPEGVSGWVVSPDGKTLVAKDQQQRFWLYPVAHGAPRQLDGPSPSDVPARWSADPRFLFFSTDTTRLPVRVYRLDLETGRKEPWYSLNPGEKAGFFGTGPVQITPDGKSCVNSYMSIHSVLYLARDIR
jgi:eukaryotic-like serine/threonine-protein kinase